MGVEGMKIPFPNKPSCKIQLVKLSFFGRSSFGDFSTQTKICYAIA